MNIQEISNEVYKIVRNGGYVTSSDACEIADAVREIPIIAAAPDLLEACKLMLTAMKLANWENDYAAVKGMEAIAKAEQAETQGEER